MSRLSLSSLTAVLMVVVVAQFAFLASSQPARAQQQVQPAYVRLQPTSPGVQQTGNSNITGRSVAVGFAVQYGPNDVRSIVAPVAYCVVVCQGSIWSLGAHSPNVSIDSANGFIVRLKINGATLSEASSLIQVSAGGTGYQGFVSSFLLFPDVLQVELDPSRYHGFANVTVTIFQP
ncbi:MAG: hypothetical protein JSS66_01875 [Armatimonadetes bacterium]|nr:hypothetical protein [Armatimonadota bacterium]